MGLRNTRLWIAVVLGSVALSASAANIYRYVDDSGRTVYDSKIPPEYVKNGYTILNERGQVVQVVPRAPTSEEIAERDAQRQAEERAAQEAVARREADNLLLRLYRGPADIERKRDEKLEQLDVQRTVLTASLNKTEQEVERLQGIVERSRAASLEPTSDVIESLKFQSAEQARLNTQLANIDKEEAQTRLEAERDSARLRELLGIPEQTAP